MYDPAVLNSEKLTDGPSVPGTKLKATRTSRRRPIKMTGVQRTTSTLVMWRIVTDWPLPA